MVKVAIVLDNDVDIGCIIFMNCTLFAILGKCCKVLLYACIRQHWYQPYHVENFSPAVFVSMGNNEVRTSEISK